MLTCYFIFLTGSKNVETNLQNMFEGELGDEDMGPEDVEDAELEIDGRLPLTLDSVA